jgi:hypothetical protein
VHGVFGESPSKNACRVVKAKVIILEKLASKQV